MCNKARTKKRAKSIISNWWKVLIPTPKCFNGSLDLAILSKKTPDLVFVLYRCWWVLCVFWIISFSNFNVDLRTRPLNESLFLTSFCSYKVFGLKTFPRIWGDTMNFFLFDGDFGGPLIRLDSIEFLLLEESLDSCSSS